MELQAADTRANAATHTAEQIADDAAALQYLDFCGNTRCQYLLVTTQVYVATRAAIARWRAI
jgi:hypothetical protein